MIDPDQIPRRIKAARMLAGIPSANALAARLDAKGLSGETIRKMEAGTRTVRPYELRAIADACGLPFEFFTVDFATLGDAAGVQQNRELTAAVEQIVGGLIPDIEDAVTRRVLRRLGMDPGDV